MFGRRESIRRRRCCLLCGDVKAESPTGEYERFLEVGQGLVNVVKPCLDNVRYFTPEGVGPSELTFDLVVVIIRCERSAVEEGDVG